MSKYLGLYSNHTAYESGNSQLTRPWVAYCEEEDEVHYKSTLKTNGHQYVDLGLSSGTLWATCNIGANSQEELGNKFAWGETTTKDTYSWSTYKYGTSSSNLTKYNSTDKLTALEIDDDAAHINWGGDWLMPSTVQLTELYNGCTWSKTTLNDVSGYLGTSKANSKTIFLPIQSGDNFYWGRNMQYSGGTKVTYGGTAIKLNNTSIYKETGTERYKGCFIRPTIKP